MTVDRMLPWRILAILAFGLTIKILPIALFDMFPTQDGPAHFNTAAALARLDSHQHDSQPRILEETVGHKSNFFATQAMRQALNHGAPGNVETLAWTVLLSILVLTIGLNLAASSDSGLYYAPLGFLIVGGALTSLGFMNFLVGLALFIQTIFVFNMRLHRQTPLWAVAVISLSALTYFAHPLAGFAVGAALGPFATSQIAMHCLARRYPAAFDADARQQSNLNLYLAAFGSCLILVFLAFNDDASQMGRLATSVLAPSEHGASVTPLPPAAHVGLLPRVTRAISFTNFVSYSLFDRLVSLIFAVTFVMLLVSRVRALRSTPANLADNWLLSAGTLLALAIFVPLSFEHFFWLRMTTCLAIVLVVWASTQHFSGRILHIVFFAGIASCVGSTIGQVRWTAYLKTILAEYESVSAAIPDRAIVLSIHSKNSDKHGCKVLDPELPCAFKPTLHYLDAILARRNVSYISNYQLRPTAGFFPLRLREPWERYTPEIEGLIQWQLPTDPQMRQAKLAHTTRLLSCFPPDIIVTWDEAKAVGTKRGSFSADVRPLLKGYAEIFTSKPTGAASVYRRLDAAQNGPDCTRGELE